MTQIEKSGLYLTAFGVLVTIVGAVLGQLDPGQYRATRHPVHFTGMMIMLGGLAWFLVCRAAEQQRLRIARDVARRGIQAPLKIAHSSFELIAGWRRRAEMICAVGSLLASSTIVTGFATRIVLGLAGGRPPFGLVDFFFTMLLAAGLTVFVLGGLAALFLRGMEGLARRDALSARRTGAWEPPREAARWPE